MSGSELHTAVHAPGCSCVIAVPGYVLCQPDTEKVNHMAQRVYALRGIISRHAATSHCR